MEKSLGCWQRPQLPQLPPPLLLPIDGEGGRKPAEEEAKKIRSCFEVVTECFTDPGKLNLLMVIRF